MYKNQPQSVERAPEGQGRSEDLRARGSETVLVVEDEDAVRTIARRILEKYGYTVLDANGPERAVAIVAALDGPIHLLLTDMVMPGMGGQALALLVTESRPEIRVVFMSGYSDAPERYGLTERRRFLQKPFTPIDLVRMVRGAIDARDWS